MKIYQTIFLLLFVLLYLSKSTQSYNATWGKPNGSKYLLLRENVLRYPIINYYWNVNVDFPRPGFSNKYKITMILVHDHFKNSSGAQANLWSGGPGYKFVKLRLQSQLSRGINSTVEIYGNK